jgi:hypothetical protein
VSREVQARVLGSVRLALDGDALLTEESCPPWLLRPGVAECCDVWEAISAAYGALTGLTLPAEAPTRESRRLDAVLTWADGTSQAVEVDEVQHFSPQRLITFDHYPRGSVVGYNVSAWRAECAVPRKQRGGGWGKAKPPLFPGDGGRHRQRAFRDMLADLLPPEHGWRPTVRLHAESVDAMLRSPEAPPRIHELVAQTVLMP